MYHDYTTNHTIIYNNVIHNDDGFIIFNNNIMLTICLKSNNF